jgi:hypothetical protein
MRTEKHKSALVLVGPLSFNTAQDESSGGLGQAVQGRIGQCLRSMYDHVVDAPIPEQFRQILASLDERQR